MYISLIKVRQRNTIKLLEIKQCRTNIIKEDFGHFSNAFFLLDGFFVLLEKGQQKGFDSV